ncbi:SMI1/KNR4 family protein [Kitasatospora sp. NPDC093806]|uniref:SMI1/KNR4 family protein n=1 Tax=Kitasatospora sp. NPDC093806 TaxID=3155075 RepID=UPI0034429482
MAGLDDLVQLFGPPPVRDPSPDDWAEVEGYLGSALPGEFKAFLDAYGTGLICGELVVFHPRGSSPLLDRMRKIHESFGQSWRRDSDEYPFRFHPAASGLISWGYDYFGDEHFFWPCDADPDRWKIVTNINGGDPEVFDGSFIDFLLAFVDGLRAVDPHHGIDQAALEFLAPEDLEELAERGEIGPVEPSFEPF